MNMRMKSSGRLRSSGSIARSISGRAKTRKIEDNRPLSEAYRVLQQKMGDCPPSPVFSCVPGYGGERTSPHSSVARGEGVVQRWIKAKKKSGNKILSLEEVYKIFGKKLEDAKEGGVDLCWNVFIEWAFDSEVHSFKSIAEMIKAIKEEVKRKEIEKKLEIEREREREIATMAVSEGYGGTMRVASAIGEERSFAKEQSKSGGMFLPEGKEEKEEGQQKSEWDYLEYVQLNDFERDAKIIANWKKKPKSKSNKVAPGINKDLNYQQETSTHVGFEIELGFKLNFPKENKQQLEDMVNETLAVCYLDKGYITKGERTGNGLRVLEMVIDDIGDSTTDKEVVTAQVEFRTSPLEFEYINRYLRIAILKAISDFKCEELRSGMSVYSTDFGYWVVGPKKLPKFHSQTSMKMTSPNLAQHVTISIEPEAFAKLREEQQKVLVPYLVGCRSVKKIFDCMIEFVKGDRDDKKETKLIDATTTGRSKAGRFMEKGGNSEGICFKTPLEAIFAAFSTLPPPDLVNKIIGNVTVGEGYSYTIQDFVELKKKIIDSKKFPRKQGENEVGSGKVMNEYMLFRENISKMQEFPEKKSGKDMQWLLHSLANLKKIGYRVVAEKLQPLFLDQTSGIPRILIEHRGGALWDQINSALNGVGGLREIMEAVKDMDDYRQILQPDGSRKLSSKQLDDIKRQQNYVEKQKQKKREEDIRRSEQEDKHRNEKVLLEPKQDIALYSATTYDQLDDQLMKLCDTGVKKSVKVTIPDRVQKNPSVFGTSAYMMLGSIPTKLSGSGMKNSGGKIPGKAQESSDMLKTVSHGIYSPQGPFGVSGVKKGQGSIKQESRDQGKSSFVMGAGFSVLPKPKGKEK